MDPFESKRSGDHVEIPVALADAEPPLIPPCEGAPWQLRIEERCEKIRPFIAEAIATFFYTLFGCGAIGTFVVTRGQQGSVYEIALAFAFGIAFAIYFAVPFSGGHTSVAITAMFCAFRKFPWKILPIYFVFHVIGAFVAAAFVYLSFYSSLRALFPEEKFPVLPLETANIFITFPKPGVSTGYLVWTEFIANVVLAFTVMFFIDNNNRVLAKNLSVVPIMIGFAVFVIIIGIGYQGIALNPGRDLGARLFAMTIYGADVFKTNNYYFWIPLTMPTVGSLVGAGVYDLLFYKHARPKN